MPACPICKRENQDPLKHLRLAHDITDPEQYQVLVDNAEKAERLKLEFRDFVSQLNEQQHRGSISAEQYRETYAKWRKEHEEE